MLTNSKRRILGCGLAAGLLLAGCSGGGPPEASPSASISPSATATATATPVTTPSPQAAGTPMPGVSPLGGKPATEEEKEYYGLQKQGQGLVLSRNYKDAIPLLEQAYEQQPKDMQNSFYLLLSHGSLEVVPSKGSAAYPYAKQVVELAPGTNEASRAREYLVGAEFKLPKDFKYTDRTFALLGGFIHDPSTAYALNSNAVLQPDLGPRLGKAGKASLWEAEVSPSMVKGTLQLKKGEKVQILSESHYFHSLTSWRKPLQGEPTEWSDSIFEINAFYVEVVSEGESKGKKGWLVNQIDRWIDKPGDDPWGVWIPDRLNLLRTNEPDPSAPAKKPSRRK